MATMAGNFNDGSIAGKIQLGSAWWFLDQKDGITKQMNALSPIWDYWPVCRNDYRFREVLSVFPDMNISEGYLCNIFGEEMENGELPNNKEWIGKVIQDICYHNAKSYFGW